MTGRPLPRNPGQHYALPSTFLKQLGRLDLVLIDGPPYFFNSREPALYLLFEYLAPGSLVLLDDANRRQREQRYLRKWQTYFGAGFSLIAGKELV